MMVHKMNNFIMFYSSYGSNDSWTLQNVEWDIQVNSELWEVRKLYQVDGLGWQQYFCEDRVELNFGAVDR